MNKWRHSWKLQVEMVGSWIAVLSVLQSLALPTKEMKRRSIYQVVTDRFALESGGQDTCDVGDCPYSNYCGGTFKGLQEKLDYIQGMGFDAIWISPIADNIECGYHGYWTRSLFEINKHFGDEQTFRDLIEDVHSRGMAMIVDIVLNHVGPNPTNDTDANPFAQYAPFNDTKYFHGDFKTNCVATDSMVRQQHQRETCWLENNPDLRTEDSATADLLFSWVDRLVNDFKIDGVRLDAVPYMGKGFLQTLKQVHLKDTWAVGECLVSNEPWDFTGSYQFTSDDMSVDAVADGVMGPVLDGVLNYFLWGQIQGIFHDDNAGKQEGPLGNLVEQYAEWQKVFKDLGANGNFVDCHDQPRWHWHSPEWSTYKNAFATAFFMPGVPIAFYGAEQGIKGSQEDYNIRAPMWLTGYHTDHPLYQWTRRTIIARRFMLAKLDDEHIDDMRHFVATPSYVSFLRGDALVVLMKKLEFTQIEVIVAVQTDLPEGTWLCDGLQPVWRSFGRCALVGEGGILRLGLGGDPRVMLPPGAFLPSRTKILMLIEAALVPLWLLPVVAFFIMGFKQRRLVKIVEHVAQTELEKSSARVVVGKDPELVLFASVEHQIQKPTGGAVKVVAGGLGKVMGLLCQDHPGAMACVHPCMKDQDYGFAKKDKSVDVVICGERVQCKVFVYARPTTGNQPKVTFYLIDHPVFRHREAIYPTTMTRRSALVFFSMWNQCVAKLIDRIKPDIYHCPDFHGAMAVMYVERPLPVVVTLHNADYQGNIQTQQLGNKEAEKLGEIFNLPADQIKKDAFSDGAFNMLRTVVEYAKAYQRGYGICAVSNNYAEEVCQKHSVFWGLPEVRGIENCMPEAERGACPKAGVDVVALKRAAKMQIQDQFGLTRDPDARLFVFLGRWVKQKGMDYIADVTEWMLDKHPKAQLVMIGPVGDAYGSYTRMRMEGLVESKRYQGRLFAFAGFLSVPPDLKLACDFCLMPSRDEPFGYVDIEFAWFGAAIVGSFRGGLGKLPGFYFAIQNSESATHMQDALKGVIQAAMECDEKTLAKMMASAMSSVFPVEDWMQELRELYSLARQNFNGSARPSPKRREQTNPQAAKQRSKSGLRAPLLGASGGSSSIAPSGLPPIESCGNMELLLASAGADDDAEETGPVPENQGVPVGLGDFKQDTFPLGATGDSERDIDMVSLASVEIEGRLPFDKHGRNRSYTSTSESTLGLPRTASESAFSTDGDIHISIRNPQVEMTGEFLRQEAKEEAVQGFVEAKAAITTYTKQNVVTAQILLDETMWELELARETTPSALFLGKTIGGLLVIDWLISLLFVAGPLITASFLAFTPASFTFQPDHDVQINQVFAESIAVVLWTLAALKVAPHRLLAFAAFCRLGVLLFSVFPTCELGMAWALGAISAGDLVFIYYNFMGYSVGDVSVLTVRIGLILAVRRANTWLLQPFGTAPGSLKYLALVLSVMLCTIPPLMLLRAPACYRDFRLPNVLPQLKSLRFVRTLLLLGFASVCRGLTFAATTVFTSWKLASPASFVVYCVLISVGSLVAALIVAGMFKVFPNSAIVLVKTFACLSFPVMIMRCWPTIDASSAEDVLADPLTMVLMVLDGLFNMTTSVAVLSVAASRWRFIVYNCVVTSLTGLAKAFSFTLLEKCVGTSDLPLSAALHPSDISMRIFLLLVGLSVLEFAARVCSMHYFDLESTSMLWTRRMTTMVRALNEKNKATK
jgi:glycosidase/glycogen synthase